MAESLYCPNIGIMNMKEGTITVKPQFLWNFPTPNTWIPHLFFVGKAYCCSVLQRIMRCCIAESITRQAIHPSLARFCLYDR